MKGLESLIRPGRLSGLAFAAFALAVPGCGGPERAPDVVIIVLDTARQDRMSAFGYERPTTPQLERLQERSRTFPRAWSTSAWTVPAHASLLTGLYPATHGATQENWTLAQDLDTLAEILSGQGYQTAAVVGNGLLTAERHFGQGFSEYVETFRDDDRLSSGKLLPDSRAVEEIDRILASTSRSAPLFLFVNLIGPHSPYNSCGSHCDRFVTDRSIELEDNQWLAHYVGLRKLSASELRHLSERYDAELLEVDDRLGRIVEAFERQRGLENAFLVVTSDHGENFGEHGHMDHVFSLNETLTRIPLVVHYPPLFEPGSEDQRQVQLPDVFATALHVAGLDPKEHVNQGRDLSGPVDPERAVLLEYYQPVQALGSVMLGAPPAVRERLERWNQPLNALVRGDWKLIVSGNGLRELYDLARDPTEIRNLAYDAAHVDRVADLEHELDGLRDHYAAAAGAKTTHVPVSDETRRALKAMGYVE